MAWPETRAIKLGRPFLSVPSPTHCTEINESWVKQRTQKSRRGSEREMGGVGVARSVAIPQQAKDKYKQKCHISCVDKEERRRRRFRWRISKNKSSFFRLITQ